MDSRSMKYLATEEKVEDKKEERNLDYNFDNLDISVNILLVLKHFCLHHFQGQLVACTVLYKRGCAKSIRNI